MKSCGFAPVKPLIEMADHLRNDGYPAIFLQDQQITNLVQTLTFIMYIMNQHIFAEHLEDLPEIC